MWQRLRHLADGLWLVPGLVVCVFALLGIVVGELERSGRTTNSPFVYSGDASAAATILSTIAGSLITVAGLTFSITIVTLQLVSSQYSPLALRDFLVDRVTQLTAGVFVGVFAFSLLVLRTVSAGAERVPQVGVTLAIGLAVGALGLLLFFIHHTLSRMRVGRIAADIRRRAERVHPTHEDGSRLARPDPAEGASVHASSAGFVVRVDLATLERSLPPGATSVRVHARVGDFVVPGACVLDVTVAELGRDEAARLADAVVVGDERDMREDEALGLRQLADIALRALSPALDDPTTACTCIGHMTALLQPLSERPDGSQSLALRSGSVDVSLARVRFDELLEPLLEVGRRCEDGRTRSMVLAALETVARGAHAAGCHDNADIARREAMLLEKKYTGSA
jgi:uncharacterized membrane protein